MLLAVSGVLCVVCVCMGMAMMQSLGRLQLVEKELTAMQTSYQTLAENLEDARVQSVFAMQKQPPDRRGAAGTKAKLYRGKRRQLRIYQQEILRGQQRDSENHGGKRIGKCRYDFRGADTADSVREYVKIGESLWF